MCLSNSSTIGVRPHNVNFLSIVLVALIPVLFSHKMGAVPRQKSTLCPTIYPYMKKEGIDLCFSHEPYHEVKCKLPHLPLSLTLSLSLSLYIYIFIYTHIDSWSDCGVIVIDLGNEHPINIYIYIYNIYIYIYIYICLHLTFSQSIQTLKSNPK